MSDIEREAMFGIYLDYYFLFLMLQKLFWTSH